MDYSKKVVKPKALSFFRRTVTLGIILSLIIFSAAVGRVYAEQAGSQADSQSANLSGIDIKRLEAKLDKAVSEINRIKKRQEQSSNGGYLSNTQLFGTLIGSYTYNTAKPATVNTSSAFEGNGNYINDWQTDGFAANLAEITVRRSPGTAKDPYGVGFHVTADFGQNIQPFKAYYGGSTSYFTSPFVQRDPYDILSAYVNISIPVGNGLDVHIGKEPELLGFEAFNPVSNWNDTYSLLTDAEPATLTGVFVAYNFIPQLTSTLGIANTANSAVPIDNLPVIELNESLSATSMLTFNGGLIYGANSYMVSNGSLYGDNLNKSTYGYINAQLTPDANWSFVLDYELGLAGGINSSVLTENGLAASAISYPVMVQTSGDTYDKARFVGIVGYIHHQSQYGFGQLAETFREAAAYDQNGFYEPASIPGTGNTFIDSTFTLAYQPSYNEFKSVQIRLELERQGSNHPVYLDSNGLQSHSQQDTVNLMVLYSF